MAHTTKELTPIGLSLGRIIGGDGRVLDALSHEYGLAVSAAGGLPVLFPVVESPRASHLLDGVAGLLLTGGGDVDPSLYGEQRAPETAGVDPSRDASEIALITAALERHIPILAVCRGVQLLNVACGGSLYQHLETRGQCGHLAWDRRTELVHPMRLIDESLLAEIVGNVNFGVNSVHHQGLNRVGTGLIPVGFANDGLIEAVEDRERNLVGVQWHPELLLEDRNAKALFAWIVAAASERITIPVEQS